MNISVPTNGYRNQAYFDAATALASLTSMPAVASSRNLLSSEESKASSTAELASSGGHVPANDKFPIQVSSSPWLAANVAINQCTLS